MTPSLPLPTYTFRSKVETYTHCKRKRFLSYELDINHSSPVKGIQSTRLSIPLTTGSSIHIGMETILSTDNIELAIQTALDHYHVTVTGESLLIEPMKGEEGLGLKFGSDVMEWVIGQEMALVEGLLRAFYVSTWQWFKEKYEVLLVEKDMAVEIEPGLVYLTKTDALVQDRETQELILQSFKSLAYWDWKSQKSYQYDRQNLSEPWGVETKMKEWWSRLREYVDCDPNINAEDIESFMKCNNIPSFMSRFAHAGTPPEIYLVQMGILKKGPRKPDEKRGPGFNIQYCPLTTGYVNPSRVDALGPHDPSCYAWSWDVPKEGKDGMVYKGSLGYTNWKRMFVWRDVPGGVKQWIEWLEAGLIQPEVTDSIFSQCIDFSEPLNKRSDHISRWFQGMVYQEKEIMVHSNHVNQLIREEKWDEVIYSLDLLFPPNGKCANYYGGLCEFIPLCWENPGMLYNILGSGLYKIRENHHELEGEVE